MGGTRSHNREDRGDSTWRELQVWGRVSWQAKWCDPNQRTMATASPSVPQEERRNKYPDLTLLVPFRLPGPPTNWTHQQPLGKRMQLMGTQ